MPVKKRYTSVPFSTALAASGNEISEKTSNAIAAKTAHSASGNFQGRTITPTIANAAIHHVAICAGEASISIVPRVMLASPAHIATWCIAALAIVGVIVRPWKLPEALWAVFAAIALLVFSLISLPDAARAVLKGTDVYLFLTGMMLLAELARHEGLFDWLAAFAVKRSNGSPTRLFGLVYLVGIIVTIFLSNDATAVVLTPAVYAATKQAKANPLPFLFICALIANAASFVLPISNPANLVVYGAHMPSLGTWLAEFGLSSIASIAVTFVVLRLTQRAELTREISRDIQVPTLSRRVR